MTNDPKVLMLAHCNDFVNERLLRIRGQIKEVQQALGTETKSSAGDKHETGRARLQLEREKLGQQLIEAEQLYHILQKVDIASPTTSVSLGSLVITTKANYFVAISAGEVEGLEGANYCISLNTPIGIMLLGKSVGQSIYFNNNQMEILEIR